MSIVEPCVLELLKHADSRYTLVVEASKRGRQIIGGSKPLLDNEGMKPLKTAVEDKDDPVLGITTRIGNAVSDAIRSWLRREGLDEEPANTWGHGAVGFIWAVSDRWIVTNLRRPRAEVVAYIDQLFTPAFDGIRRS